MFLDVENPTIEKLSPDSMKAVTQQLLHQVKDDPNSFLTTLGEHALQFGMKLLSALLIYMIGAWLIRYIKKMLTALFTRKKTEKTLASFVTSLVSISLTTLLIVITVSTLGINTTSLAALLAAGGMAIGMALSGTVQNFAGGIMLLIFKPFKAGDFIEAMGYMGTVMSVTIVSTKILTTDNRVIILPNGTLFNGTINNFSAQPLRRVDLEVSVEYGTDADACIDLLMSMILEDERVLTSKDKRPRATSPSAVDLRDAPIPDPFVGLLSLNANDITFVTRSWVLSENYWDVRFDLQKRFYTELPKHGFSFAYPHMDVKVVKE